MTSAAGPPTSHATSRNAGPTNIAFGSEVRAHSALESGLDTGDKPTLAAVALLHLKRTAAISAVESHLIERVNGGFGPRAAFTLLRSNGGFVRIAAYLPRQSECLLRVNCGPMAKSSECLRHGYQASGSIH